MTSLIELIDVGHRYGQGRSVVSGVNLALEADGRSTAIVAPSGSGKTTLLNIVGGLLEPASGVRRVSLAGGARLPGCAWVFQTTNVLAHRSALDNAALAAQLRGLSVDESRREATAALGAVGLGEASPRPARTLSGGERQRLAVARALVAGQPFLLADEPTGQLDSATSTVVADLLFASVAARAMHLVVVTHDMDLARRCGRVLALRPGALVDA